MALTDKKKDTVKKESKKVVEMATPEVGNDVVDIQMELPKKSRFRINGDSNKILELNTSDMSIIKRLEKGYTELQKEMSKVGELDPEDEGFTQKLEDIDKIMRDQIDYIFNSNVSEICASDGTMYDPANGKVTFEHIIDTLLGLYEKNINSEYTKMKNRVRKHTDKYIGKK